MLRINGSKKNGSSSICILLEIAISEIEKAQKHFLYVVANFKFIRYIKYMDLWLMRLRMVGQLSRRSS